MCLSPSNLVTTFFHLSFRESSILSSHCFPFLHSFSRKIFVLIVVGEIRPSGLNKHLIVIKTSRFVVAESISLKCLACIQSSSLSVFQINRSTFVSSPCNWSLMVRSLLNSFKLEFQSQKSMLISLKITLASS